MKGADSKQLRELVARYQTKLHTRETVLNVLAGLGLIGFGIVLVPLISSHRIPTAFVPEATSTPITVNAFSGLALTGEAAVVYDLSTGEVLFEKNGTKQLPLASLTKLLTMYAAANALSKTASVTISETALAQDGDSGLTLGETFRLSDLERFALVASSNDAAEAIAEAASLAHKSSNRELLASAAAAAGLLQTYANNGTGLDVSTYKSGGYGSAEDVARLAGALIKTSPEIAHATIEPYVTARSLSGQSHTLPNTNQDIVHIPNPLLSKTGFTDLAGGNLVVVFDAGINHPVAVVVLGSTKEGRFTDVDHLVLRTLSHFAGIAP
ncbi:MAG: serine hydrolase [Patescibacteria group bacterium]